jgi:hypothetical protein
MAPTTKAPLPALLPDSILSTIPDIQPLIVDSDTPEQPTKKHRIFNTEPVPDIRHGDARVRLLEQDNIFLAPKKVRKSTSTLKERLLKNREGSTRKSGGKAKPQLQAGERKQAAKGFVKR